MRWRWPRASWSGAGSRWVGWTRSRRVRSGIAFDDPFGNRLELVAQQESLARPVEFTRAAGITEFGHLCLDAPDVHEAYRFWSGTFGAKVSDWIGDAACLMRIDPVHRKLAVFRGDGPGLCHINFQVASIDDVFRNWHFLVEHGVEIETGPGRHPQSTAIFVCFLGPEGFTYEYSFGVRRIEDDASWVPRTFDPEEPVNTGRRTRMPACGIRDPFDGDHAPRRGVGSRSRSRTGQEPRAS